MFNIKIQKIEDNMEYNGVSVLKITIKYPQIEQKENSISAKKFNEYYKTRARDYYEYCKTELYNLAVEDYKLSVQNEYPVHQYEAFLEPTITYNENNLISLYSNKYEYTGGAHGNTIRDSETWDMIYGKIIKLIEFFEACSYVTDILKNINKQIKEQIESGASQYFDNYCELVLNNFNEKNYYLANEGMAIYYQQYEIAPYVSAIPVFLLKI